MRRKRVARELLYEIVEKLEWAHEFLGTTSLEDFKEDFKTTVAVKAVLKDASKAASFLYHDYRKIISVIEARNPTIKWMDFVWFFDHIWAIELPVELNDVWRELQPGGMFTLIESAIREKINRSWKPPTGEINPAVKNASKRALQVQPWPKSQSRHRS